MASISLQLATPKAEKSSIICVLRDGRKVRIKIPCGLSVKIKHWSKTNKKVLSADTEAVAKNKALTNVKERVFNIYLEAKEKGLIADAVYIKDQLKPKEKANPENKKFWNVWEFYLEDRKGRFKAASFKKFKSLKNHLAGFETKTKTPWIFDSINKNKLEKLQNYFYDEGINTQTTAKYIGVFKMFLNWTSENKYSTSLDYKAFKPLQQKDSLKVALSADEVEAIRKADLQGKGYLENVRLLFILSTLTGLRFSDYSRIRQEHLKQDTDGAYILQIRQEKTGDFVELPLTPEAQSIIEQLISGSIHPISNQKMNCYVKELCEMAGIVEPFEVHKFKGKLTVSITEPKYKLISTHTGRRTFATSLLLKGIPAETVMEFTGHRDYNSFAKYVNIPKKTKMDMVKKALNQMSVA